MRISRIDFRGVLIVGIVGIVAGCGASDCSQGKMSAAPPAETAGPTEWEDADPPEWEEAASPGEEPTAGAFPETAAPDWNDAEVTGSESAEPRFPDVAPAYEAYAAEVAEESGGTDIGFLGPPAVPADQPSGAVLSFGVGGGAPRVRSLPPQAEPAPSSNAANETVDEIIKTLRDGGMAYNAPDTMQYGEPTDLELVISLSEPVETVATLLRDPSNARSAGLQIGNRMEAVLTGAGFAIEALSPDLQAVSSTKPIRWQWRVTPTRHGRQQLRLQLHAHIDVDGRDTPYVVETKDAVIDVNITVGQRVAGFVEKNWQWLWAAVVLPVFGYHARRRKRTDEEPPRRAAA